MPGRRSILPDHFFVLNQGEAEEIANTLGVYPEDVTDMETHMHRPNASFDGPIRQSAEEFATHADVIQSSDSTPESWATEYEFLDSTSNMLQQALNALDERNHDTITSRCLVDDEDKLTLIELGALPGQCGVHSTVGDDRSAKTARSTGCSTARYASSEKADRDQSTNLLE